MRRHDRVAEHEQRVDVRVVLDIVGRGVGAAGPHGTARGSLTLNLAPQPCLVRRMDRQGDVLKKKVFGIRETKKGTKASELL